ncbi:Nadh-ubiquinone oxidoreductase kda subunit [Lasiodiplodia theobromae]|uniref:NADH-ubiquinone oxidoreductase 17.8 kDa subunit n=1 Tax=Lasiodiplodia theobromae TaxID=45133 RepID=A0A5N5DIQ5_9PEZI|nr:Nadh-ubiquinone oxidoreductase kda subunit [Lasiodiplodia theobromae]KAB2577745.1 NADH-ubiquinone oxidoreductase 17.8 kDa subunit [Lasiodiplodia theobromae]KAF4538407.1 Nadh-ubiquinone oxidoreductase kda subunit [Lasiodiplodia theobromae]
MFAARRSAARAAQASRAAVARQSRRAASHDAHHHHAADAHHGPKEEHFSTGFYFAVGLIPAGFLLYQWTGTPNDPADGRKPYFTRMVDMYSDYRQTWAERNKLHTDMIEQAAFDRHLFLNSTPRRHVDLTFPEAFNCGSPYNVPAGSQADLSKVIEHYEKVNYEENAKKLEALKNGTLKAEQPPSKLGSGKAPAIVPPSPA